METISQQLLAPDALLERRLVSLYGDINEENSKQLIEKLFMLYSENDGIRMELISEDPPLYSPISNMKSISLILSTYGGYVDEALAIYDVMRMIQQDCEIHTFGIGKVQSAGVLVLAAGTKGKRKIGRNCQVMIHNLHGNFEGNFRDLEEHHESLKILEKQWNECLLAETKLTDKKLMKLLEKKSDIFLSPEEVVKCGIADEIV